VSSSLNRICVLFASCVILACADDPGAVQMQPAPFFTLSGVVRDAAGIPVADAEVAISSTFKFSSDSGYFAFERVRGDLTVIVTKAGFEDYGVKVRMDSNVDLDVRLQKQLVVSEIIVGKTLAGTIHANALPCDPVRWDANAPCRRLSFIAPVSGILVLTLRWTGTPPLDAVVTNAFGDYLAYSEKVGGNQAYVALHVDQARRYEVRVSSYYGAQLFELTTELHADR
jgi:Carboxypeptidase regulatory-like domain